MESWGGEKMDGGGRLSLSGPARFGPVRVGSAPKVSIWCRRDGTFSKWVAFAVGETTLDYSGVDETLGGKCRFLIMGVLRRWDANLQTAFPIVSPDINILVSARRRIRFPRYVFGVDETSCFLKSEHSV